MFVKDRGWGIKNFNGIRMPAGGDEIERANFLGEVWDVHKKNPLPVLEHLREALCRWEFDEEEQQWMLLHAILSGGLTHDPKIGSFYALAELLRVGDGGDLEDIVMKTECFGELNDVTPLKLMGVLIDIQMGDEHFRSILK